MSLKVHLNVLGKTVKYIKVFYSNTKGGYKTDKEGNKAVGTISYKRKFIDSIRFMATSLTKLVDNLSEEIHKIKCKECDCSLTCDSIKNNLIKYKCLSCNKNYSEKLTEELKNKFKNTFKFSNNDVNKFMLLLIKGVYPYDYMNDWERFNEMA